VPDSVLEEIAVVTFVNGLKDSEIQNALRLATPKVLGEALAIALEHETASQTSRSHRVRTIEESDEHNDERLEEMIRRVFRNEMPKRCEPRCWNCGDVGHIRRNCKKIVQPSPDSDDTFGGDEPEEDFSGRDDQFLVSDRTENKFYGTVHGGGSATSTGGVVGATVGPSLGYIGRRLQAATYLCPAIFPWVDTGPATEESGMFVMKMVGNLYILIIIFDLIVVCGMDNMNTATSIFLWLFFLAIVAICLMISRKPQNRNTLMFMTPGLPFIPVVAITVNIYLIMKLSILTLVRFTTWMTLGFIMYFYYGIKNSTLEEGPDTDQNIELTVTDHEKPKYNSNTPYGGDHNIFSQSQPTYDWDPNKSWDHGPAWAQPAQPQNPATSQPQLYQVEQRYNVNTNNTKSVINKSNPPVTRPSTKPSTQPAGSQSSSQPSASNSSNLFVSDPLAYANWDD
uniref:Uncharacterized protein LOC114339982 n=1 Tax=Diabrotica virgifera virgifera TaxID=50390 RepID=A0A6P7GBB8_DIAVI